MRYNKGLVIRFGQWILAHSDNPRDGNAIINAARNNSPLIGKRIKLALENARVTENDVRQEFNEDELVELFGIPDKYDPNYDYTKRKRAARRQALLNKKARELGFDGLSQMLTAWKNGEIELVVK